jgi:HD-GYP domain-containing protein (c-di-GMP phosphodiesterase class II)
VAAWLEECGSADAWARAAAWDPAPAREVAGDSRDEACLVMADLVDIKTPITVGHSRGVAELARGAAGRLGLPKADVHLVWQAALAHDLGRVAVPNSIWDKPGPLSSAEWEEVRLHPYRLERFFARSPWLSELGALGSTHHERMDGSGYHRGLSAGALTVLARLLAAADVYQALTEVRPHRPALSAESAGATLRGEVREGRLNGEAVDAVLGAAGHRVRRLRRDWPAGLTSREVEVLRLVARGFPNKQIAAKLFVSSRTVGHHIAHVYYKIGASTRAGATLYALQNDLLAEISAV